MLGFGKKLPGNMGNDRYLKKRVNPKLLCLTTLDLRDEIIESFRLFIKDKIESGELYTNDELDYMKRVIAGAELNITPSGTMYDLVKRIPGVIVISLKDADWYMGISFSRAEIREMYGRYVDKEAANDIHREKVD
jgi:hypothetical protein